MLAAATLAHATPLPAAEQPRSTTVSVTPISGPLGLADIEITSRDAHPVLHFAEHAHDYRPIWTVRSTSPGDHDRYRARVYLPPAHAENPRALSLTVRDPLGEHVLGPMPISTAPPAGHATPDWAKGAVWYQIFPERFRNANPRNDPRPPHAFRKPWTADWFTVEPDELDFARDIAAASPVYRSLPPSRPGGALRNVVFNRRYGGDLQGVTQKLPYLQDLGVTAIYLNPIFHARSLHKYDASDYRHIDPTLAHPADPYEDNAFGFNPDETENPTTWTITPADDYFINTLLPEARRNNLRVVLDGVWNHVGLHHYAFQDILKHGERSRYASWFDVDFATPDLYPDWPTSTLDTRPGRPIAWNSWNSRSGALPEFAETAQGKLVPPVQQHVFHVTKRWMDPNNDNAATGIDGWRLDVVGDIPMPFWQDWRDHVKSINPDAYTVAEIWHVAESYFEHRSGPLFDAQMNYPFATPVIRWLQEDGYSADQLARELGRAFDADPQHTLVQQNLLASHDTARYITMLYNPGRAYEDTAPTSPGYRNERPPQHIYDRSILGLALQVASPGAPMIYYADEYGAFGADDPDCRKPFPWPDLAPFDNPQDNPDTNLHRTYREWLRLRQHPLVGDTLKFGSWTPIPTPSPSVFAFTRSLNNNRVLAVINKDDSTFDASDLLPPNARPIAPGQQSGNAVPPVTAAIWFYTIDTD